MSRVRRPRRSGNVVSKQIREIVGEFRRFCQKWAGFSHQTARISSKYFANRAKLCGVGARMRAVEAKLCAAEGRLHGAEARLRAVEARLRAVEGRLWAAEGRLWAAEARLRAAEARSRAARSRNLICVASPTPKAFANSSPGQRPGNERFGIDGTLKEFVSAARLLGCSRVSNLWDSRSQTLSEFIDCAVIC